RLLPGPPRAHGGSPMESERRRSCSTNRVGAARPHGLARPGLAMLLMLATGGIAHAQTREVAGEEDSSRAHTEWKSTPPRVFGYVQVFYRYAFATGDDSLVDNDNFRVQRVRIGVEGDLSRWVSYDVELDPRAP